MKISNSHCRSYGNTHLCIETAIQWWLEPTQQQNYPNLAQMAIGILSVNPMSAKSQRVFSGCRSTMSWDRASLSAANLGYIEYLKSWQKNLCFERFDSPIDKDAGNTQEDQSEPLKRQGDPIERQGDSGDDGVGIGIIPLDN